MSYLYPTTDDTLPSSRLKQPPQPKKWPTLPVEPPSKDYSIRGENTPGDAPPIPTRSRYQYKQPAKQPHLLLHGLPSSFESLGKNPPNNPPLAPRTTRAQLLAGQRVNPKDASGLPPVPDYKPMQSNDSLAFGGFHAFDQKDLPQEPISDWSHVDPADRREDRGRGRSASSPPSTTNPPPPSTSLPPLFEAPTATNDDPVARAEQERRQRRMEGAFARLFLESQGAGEQEYGGGGSPNVQIHQPVYQTQQDVVARQQQQLSQLQQSVFTQEEREWQFPQAHHEAILRQLEQQLQLQQEQLSQAQQVAFHQDQSVSPQQQQQWQSSRVQQTVAPQQQQQPQPPLEVQPGLYLVYDPATQGYKYACGPLQSSGVGANLLSDVTKPWKDPSRSSEAVRQPTIPMVKSESPAKEDEHEDRIGDQRPTTIMNEPRDLQDSSPAMISQPPDTFFSRFGGDYSDATPETAAKKVVEMLLRQNHELNTGSSESLNKVKALNEDDNESDVGQGFEFYSTDEGGMKAPDPMELEPSVTADTLPASHSASSVFLEARERLKRLQSDIEDLSDSSDDSLESSGSDPETTILSGQHGNHTTNNVREETGASGGGLQDLHKSSEETASSSGSSPAQKRSQVDDTNEDHTRAEIGASHKRTKLSNLRFICCFHNGPGTKCSGTDKTISEVLKKLSKQHDTHVCDRCWVLKVEDESSGLFAHPNDGQACLDHCLSPQCHKTTPTVGHRHLFDPETCGTKTSRVKPGDSEAVYRFIFRLVHPDLECPASVLTAEHSLHLDAVPRQGRRKLNREELTARANDLENRLEAGEKQNLANANRITQLQQELADAHRATKEAEEKSAALEKQTRRIIAMLSDALRIGIFMDLDAHQSLLRRIEEDAPGALVHQSSLLTPSPSDGSRNSSTTPVRVNVAAQGSDQFSRPAGPAAQESAAARTVPPGAMPRDRTMDEYMSDAWNAEPAWLDIFDDPGESDNAINLQGNRW